MNKWKPKTSFIVNIFYRPQISCWTTDPITGQLYCYILCSTYDKQFTFIHYSPMLYLEIKHTTWPESIHKQPKNDAIRERSRKVCIRVNKRLSYSKIGIGESRNSTPLKTSANSGIIYRLKEKVKIKWTKTIKNNKAVAWNFKCLNLLLGIIEYVSVLSSFIYSISGISPFHPHCVW